MEKNKSFFHFVHVSDDFVFLKKEENNINVTQHYNDYNNIPSVLSASHIETSRNGAQCQCVRPEMIGKDNSLNRSGFKLPYPGVEPKRLE